MKSETALRRPTAAAPEPPVAQRVLIVEDDPVTLLLLTELLKADPTHFEPVGVASAEEALQFLTTTDGVDCLLADYTLPGIDGLQLLHSARRIKPDLKVVLMTASPTDDLHRDAVESGAARLLGKPLDLEDLLATLQNDRPGALSYLEGDLDLMDVCALFAACHSGGTHGSGGGIRVRNGQRAGVVSLRGATVIHAATDDGQEGEDAFADLRAWGAWRFESISALNAAQRPVNCALKIVEGVEPREGTKAAGNLRGLTLKHLLEWAIRSRLTGLLTVTSGQRTGVLSFEAGRIHSAVTADRDGGRAAAEILGWENVRVQLNRTPAAATPAAIPAAKGGRVQALIDRFCGEVEGFMATSIVRRQDGTVVAGRSLDPAFDPGRAAVGYASVLDSHLAAVDRLGTGAAWGDTEDILITTAKAYLLIRLLGDGHYHWLAVSNEANLAICRLQMRSYAAALLGGLQSLGEGTATAPTPAALSPAS
jgi:CheY-like chemotaxis protein/predicted regulator of Ras-like GTPase activity (Roadblock/LC7/MglB family)